MLRKRNNSTSNNVLADSEQQQPVRDTAKREDSQPEFKLRNNPQPQTQVQEEVKPVEDKPFGGKMMRLRRNEAEKDVNNAPSQQSTIDPKPFQESVPTSNLGSQRKLQMNDNPYVEPAKPEIVAEEKPMIAARRMMLRKKEQESDGGYNPTFKK